mgnify:CR=1 FL=1
MHGPEEEGHLLTLRPSSFWLRTRQPNGVAVPVFLSYVGTAEDLETSGRTFQPSTTSRLPDRRHPHVRMHSRSAVLAVNAVRVMTALPARSQRIMDAWIDKASTHTVRRASKRLLNSLRTIRGGGCDESAPYRAVIGRISPEPPLPSSLTPRPLISIGALQLRRHPGLLYPSTSGNTKYFETSWIPLTALSNFSSAVRITSFSLIAKAISEAS